LSRTILKEVRMEAAGDKLMQELRDVVAAAEELLAAAVGLVVGILLTRK
jgi:ElaB/YqjD/DUF883 family membrane-anchored ribosome-binding protein